MVNEVFNEDGTWRDTIWLRNLGPGYIADAFRWAHQADPRAKLFLNDYNDEGVSAKSDAYYALVKQLRPRACRCRASACRATSAVQYGLPGRRRWRTCAGSSALGLETAFTEVDVRMLLPPDNAKTAGAGAGLQPAAAGLPAGHALRLVHRVGFHRQVLLGARRLRRRGLRHPADENFTRKPAYDTLRDTLLLAGR